MFVLKQGNKDSRCLENRSNNKHKGSKQTVSL